MATGTTIAAITALASLGFQIGGAISAASATAAEKEEAVEDYWAAIEEVKARSAETEVEAARRIGTTKEGGILSLKEQGAQAAFEGRMAMTGAEMAASSEEARLGAAGVRAKGSPLMAAQQNVDLAFAAAERTIEKGSAGVALGGVRFKTGLADIGAATSLLTEQYRRQIAEYRRKIKQFGGGSSISVEPLPNDNNIDILVPPAPVVYNPYDYTPHW